MKKSYSKILVCIDKSENSRKIITNAIRYAKKFNSKIVLLHVQDSQIKTLEKLKNELDSASFVPTAYGTVPFLNRHDGFLIDKIKKESSENAQDVLDESSKILKTHNIKHEKRNVFGDPIEKISKFSQDGKFDLIILGDSKVGKIKRFVLGDTVSKIKKRVKIPVVVSYGY